MLSQSHKGGQEGKKVKLGIHNAQKKTRFKREEN